MKFISSIIFLVIVGVLFFFVIDPMYADVKDLRAGVAVYNTALDNSTALQKTRDALIDIYKGIKIEDRDRLNHFLPSTIGNIELILEIEKIANLHGMPVGDIKFDAKSLETETAINPSGTAKNTAIVAEADPATSLPYGVFPMEFIVEGRYDTFVEFLKDLEHNLRLVDIKSISFNVPAPVVGGLTDSNIYTFTLKVETYWLK